MRSRSGYSIFWGPCRQSLLEMKSRPQSERITVSFLSSVSALFVDAVTILEVHAREAGGVACSWRSECTGRRGWPNDYAGGGRQVRVAR